MLFLQQQTVKSLQVCWAHGRPFMGGNPACDSAFYTHANPVAAAGYFLISWITREVKSDQVRVD
jgi:hypothetical protein